MNEYSEQFVDRDELSRLLSSSNRVLLPNRVELESKEYGFELFEYDTPQDAQEGYKRIQARVAEATALDDIERRLKLFRGNIKVR